MVLDGLIEIEPKVVSDVRGFFLESYQEARYRELGVFVKFVQDNHSFSKKGVIRGMHFQKGQAKFIYCPKGEIFDVVVDIRKESKTYGNWQGFYLSGENHKQLFIPDGFAHGFAVLSQEAHVMYKVSTYYDKQLEKGFLFNDPEVRINWPIKEPILSERDKSAPLMREVV
ncbi:MAG: dTDP-4-dehydrorhamnose 3,5-epimerase [Chlamydiae bacterium]|jgi:dTDP-4-dehydrorhamnose 3,5-epimerase|nr:dTDP-4-dehydrorhamnose 3,5-epimerase [Chlamydiota bacterium]